MKMIIIIMTTCLIQVSAAGYAQRVTFIHKRAELVQIFKVIKKQTGYTIFYADHILDAKILDVDFKDTPIDKVLDECLKGKSLTYSIEGKSIVIKKSEGSFQQDLPDRFKTIEINGKVTDIDGNPLPGATIKIKGTNRNTYTDVNGEFYLQEVNENSVLLISFIGYEIKEIRVKKSLDIIKLLQISSDLKEVKINKGYYSTSKELNTGSVGLVKAEDIGMQPVNDPLLALHGRIPGLYVSQTSGLPGAEVKVQLRGRNSIANGINPFYIIDGVPFHSESLTQIYPGQSSISPFSSLSANDIESIEVLKDADATAIYGSRGANGVILITTKKGKQGRTNIDVNMSTGFGKITRKLNLMNTAQYLEMRREAFRNDIIKPSKMNYDVNGTWDTTRYTDWQKVLIGGTSHLSHVQTSVSGGNHQTQFLLSGSYKNETTVFPGNYSSKTGTVNLNLTHRSDNKKFKLDLSSNYSNNINRLPLTDLTSSIYTAPDAPEIYLADGSLNWENSTFENPFAVTKRKVTATTANLISNLTLSYLITKDLKVKGSFGYTTTRFGEIALTPFSSFNPSRYNAAGYRRNVTASNDLQSWIIEPQLDYKHQFGEHHIDLVIGTTFQENKQSGLIQTANGFASDALIENPASAINITSSNNYALYRYDAVFAQLGYNYQEKYVVNVTGRRDGSSRFGPENRFGNFGAVGISWLFYKEGFLKDKLSFLSFGKLRASIGKTGNDQLSDYAYLSQYNPNSATYFGVPLLQPDRLTNQNYRWETINKIEAAIELGLFKDRIVINAGYYRNRTGNQLVGYALPSTTGFTTVIANLPAVIENRGLEIDLTTSNIKSNGFSWTTSANITIPRNKLLSYPDIESSAYAQIYAVGQPLSVFYMYRYTGIDAKTGVYTFEDLNKDGAISYTKDRYPVFIGQRFYGGLSNTFSYKGLSLDIFIQFVKQTGSGFRLNTSPGSFSLSGTNQLTIALNRWKNPGDVAEFARYSTQYGDVYAKNVLYNQSDALITDASFIRLKSVQLSWMVPEYWTKRINVHKLKVFMQAQNLITLTGFKGMDPENQRIGGGSSPVLPPLRMITTGIQLSL